MQARALGLAAAVALGVGCLYIIRPFISSLLWAGILVFCTYPVFVLLNEKCRMSRSIASLVLVAAWFLVLVVPVIIAAPTSRAEIDSLTQRIEGLVTGGLPDLAPTLAKIPFVGTSLAEFYGGFAGNADALLATIQPYAGTIAQTALSILLSVLSGVAELLVAIFLAFFLYRDGPAIARALEGMMNRLAGARSRHLINLVANVTRGVVFGLVGTAVVQGAMTMVGLWISGVPQPILLGVVAGVLSILPVGAPLVWIPAAIWLFTQGSTGWGIFMLLYGGLGISSADNVIRPWFIARGADLPLLLTLIGALGGVVAFGFLGLFLGPVLLAVGFTLVKEWAENGNGTTRKDLPKV
ncbi:AI-2E family transporter [Rhodovarius crocodyli]|uniref:AI-2E family transporter n=1 Tax=Rhodovarius crocodyli TaxID=1979269 RepID=A0A437LXI4_9PROT|nr:AI-2E family transporter [Rhodovarius crocodyli]RVT90110.1 AI-2E family transporter [Rhodovarius crocodyli]